MVKILVGITGLAILVAGVFGFAVPLTVQGSSIHAGGDDILTCDGDQNVQVSWNIQWSNGQHAYLVHNVTVGGVDDGCDGSDVVITLTNSSGNFLAQGTVNDINLPGPNPAFNFGGSVKAADVHDVHIAIINGPSD